MPKHAINCLQQQGDFKMQSDKANTAPDGDSIRSFATAPGGKTSGLRLNLGCGFDIRAEYVNVDANAAHHPDLVSDVANLIDLADGVACEALAQDVLEHLPRAKASTALREWNRVLEPDGKLVVRVPSVVHLLRLLEDKRHQDPAAQQRLIQCMYGTQGYDGDFHLNGFTEVTLRNDLAEAGFAIRKLSIIDDWMFEVQAQKVKHVVPDPTLRLPTDKEFLHAIYESLFHRSVDPDGETYYLKIMAGGIAREAVLEALKSSDEYRAAQGAER